MEIAKKVLKYIGLAILLLLFWSLTPKGSVFKLAMFVLGCELYTHK